MARDGHLAGDITVLVGMVSMVWLARLPTIFGLVTIQEMGIHSGMRRALPSTQDQDGLVGKGSLK